MELQFKVVYPTADEIRRSLDGYASGASIHTKVQSPQQAKQLEYLRPIFHHWANDSPNGKNLADDAAIQEGGRQRAAPHIKTYIRYNNRNTIDWALLTSANLSKQAWGDAATANGEVRIASWEIGVMVWPELLDKDAIMVGTFKTGEPQVTQEEQKGARAIIGLRIPYNTPLQQLDGPWMGCLTQTGAIAIAMICADDDGTDKQLSNGITGDFAFNSETGAQTVANDPPPHAPTEIYAKYGVVMEKANHVRGSAFSDD
ncbi:hypothetical protein QQZ08_001922 [Neonectria magnoliae]|uniref:Uncharacterized protein n=1 Tax=Neonectria magnoliae TaxID=2732573 RepID=A0ABR1IF40_9HYPO